MFSPYFTQGQTRFVPGTNRERRAAEKVYVLKVYVPFSLVIDAGVLQSGFGGDLLKFGPANFGKSAGECLSKSSQRNVPAKTSRPCFSSKTKGPGEQGAPRNHPEISSQKVADCECRFLYDSHGKNRAPLWPFLGEGLWGNIRRPLLLKAPWFYC